MVKLRLKRVGKKFHAQYKIVAADARSPRDGKFIEELGHYDPHAKKLTLNKELLTKYLDQGAKPTDTVRTLLKQEQFYSNYIASKK
ncbi:ribosomal protein S16 [Metamycoplasma arthritidis]|uniref:Small ribosomal subunit protein bS16 n=1 Tax=Metamycoplasma arthritidis (strain 158L3-1) TaxID=243272 RepID=RS16_META1|nr:30S ribosomal protein S16 [Metamycoplasma arthritidis]B3PMA1.1 RecName: Full=Small ribosomal subunit protein bS16; AltName: Full=30S ribosomal protein S16 [Metamycoplasma arthritidis 158L3-1]ACF07153.1 ribosomal protein S16 [Metamycoplasma arthritidis 158L3-1]VEU78678.1 ribosomal protein S16 [Metamycoplasma arthritidis]